MEEDTPAKPNQVAGNVARKPGKFFREPKNKAVLNKSPRSLVRSAADIQTKSRQFFMEQELVK